jgi:hypothetical protein
MAAAEKPPAAGRTAEDVLAAFVRAQLAVTGQVLADLCRGSAYGIWTALLESGAAREDVELLHAWLRDHPAASAAPAAA